MTTNIPYTPEQIKMIQDAKKTMPRNWAKVLSVLIKDNYGVAYSNVYISQALGNNPRFYNQIIFNAFVDYKESLAKDLTKSMNRLKSYTYEPVK